MFYLNCWFFCPIAAWSQIIWPFGSDYQSIVVSNLDGLNRSIRWYDQWWGRQWHKPVCNGFWWFTLPTRALLLDEFYRCGSRDHQLDDSGSTTRQSDFHLGLWFYLYGGYRSRISVKITWDDNTDVIDQVWPYKTFSKSTRISDVSTWYRPDKFNTCFSHIKIGLKFSVVA